MSESVVGETVLIERLKSKVGLMKVNNKRRMSDEDDENCIISKKSKQYEEEPIEEVNVDQETGMSSRGNGRNAEAMVRRGRGM